MKFLSYYYNNKFSYGILSADASKIIDINLLSNGSMPDNMLDYLDDFKNNNLNLKKMLTGEFSSCLIDCNAIKILSPLPNPRSFRDGYAFRKHVEAGRKNRGLDMIPEYDEFPVFYFSNHNSICGPGEVEVLEGHMEQLDFEFEIAAVICKYGKNVKIVDAQNYIAGFMIMNDWSARQIQSKEMKLNLGPAKGKDFATSVGPYLVTLDELKNKEIISNNGYRYDLDMKGYVNDNLVSSDNFKNISWTFAQIIERVSYGVEIFPGDIIGSGTCATGCFLELNLKNKKQQWLQAGDKIKLTVDGLGSLVNTISI